MYTVANATITKRGDGFFVFEPAMIYLMQKKKPQIYASEKAGVLFFENRERKITFD